MAAGKIAQDFIALATQDQSLFTDVPKAEAAILQIVNDHGVELLRELGEKGASCCMNLIKRKKRVAAKKSEAALETKPNVVPATATKP